MTPLEEGVALEAIGLERAFGEIRAVDGVDLKVRVGETLALLGPNGAGKSTLLAILAGAITRDSGHVVALAGGDAWVAYVRELPFVYANLTVLEHLSFVAAGRKMADADAAIADALAATGLTEQAGRAAGTLSKGGRQRLCLAGAVLARTPVVLLDEPSTGLDPEAQTLLAAIVRRLAARGSAIVVCTHSLPIAFDVADRVAIYVRGRIADEFPRAEVANSDELRKRYLAATGPSAPARE